MDYLIRIGLFSLGAAVCASSAASLTQEDPKGKKSPSPWLVSYFLTTKPGGESYKIPDVEYFEHNQRVSVTEVVTVGEDGKFTLGTEGSIGYYQVDQKFRPKDGKTYSAAENRAVSFRGKGQITREAITLNLELSAGTGFWTTSGGANWRLQPERTGADFLAHGWAPFAYKQTRKADIDYKIATPRFLPVVETVEMFQLFPEAPPKKDDPKKGDAPPWADLAVSMKGEVIAAPAQAKEKKVPTRVSYKTTVTNKGPAAAVGVLLIQYLPGSFKEISAKVSQGSSSGSHKLVCKLGDLPSGATATVEIVAISAIEGSKAAIPYRSTAIVRSDVFDPDWANNLATEVVKAEPKRD